MKGILSVALILSVLVALIAGHGMGSQDLPGGSAGDAPALTLAGGVGSSAAGLTAQPVGTPDVDPEALTAVVQRTCMACHNPQLMTGNLSLVGFDVADPMAEPETAEKVIGKLRAEMMPPPGIPRPGGDTLVALVETLERLMDEAVAAAPNPGDRPFQRLNQPEYARSIKRLLDLDIDASQFLPLDQVSANFDNIADVQLLSPTLLEAYLNAAGQVSRLAIGDRRAQPTPVTYEVSPYVSQWERIEGAPFGTRGGISVIHNFPADGEYRFRFAFPHTTTGGYYGSTTPFEQLELSINGERVALLDMDQWMHVSDPNAVSMEVEDPIFVRAGPQRVTAAFIQRAEGPIEDLMSPHDWSLADRQIGAGGYGITTLPHVKDLVIHGPFTVEGISETPSRARIFSCYPESSQEEEACAAEILDRLGAEAFRRPLTERDRADLMAFYERGASEGDFESGIQMALQAMLAAPDFVFRYEMPAGGAVQAGQAYRISDLALASRLSFFLWGLPPDEELIGLASEGRLSGDELEVQVRRMLADPRAEALSTRFAAQWLRLQDLNIVNPDGFWFPDFDQQLADAMRRETELFFYNLVKEDRSVLELFDADYSFLNERLARHYGISGVVGSEFRRVEYPDRRRGGILGHGSILTLTSHANRTSPVLRGKWVMEVLLGTPPPPPPPGVPDLDETDGAGDQRFLTTRERMAIHAANPSCNSCHVFMDPIGLALDNFDVTGKWRIRESGMPLDTRGEMYDGTPVTNPMELRAALLSRPIPLIRTFTENMMAYATGRRVEYFDQPVVRAIANQAAEEDYRISAFILGVVNSDAFQMRREQVAEDQDADSR